VRTILRRASRADESTGARHARVGDVELDHEARRARRGGEVVHLTSTEFDLVWFLAARPGAVFPREQLPADVWGYRDGSGARTVDSHVRAIRSKLGVGVIRTVHGFGYGIGDGES
jgi:DNA-binding response OmpR family regulator